MAYTFWTAFVVLGCMYVVSSQCHTILSLSINWISRQDVHSVGTRKMLFGCAPKKLVRVQPEFVHTVTIGTETRVAMTETCKVKRI